MNNLKATNLNPKRNEISKQREKNGNIPIMKIIKHIFPFNLFFNSFF